MTKFKSGDYIYNHKFRYFAKVSATINHGQFDLWVIQIVDNNRSFPKSTSSSWCVLASSILIGLLQDNN